MTFIELAKKVLGENVQPMTANEIWEQATQKGYDRQLNSQGKTPWQTLYAQIYVNVKDSSRTPFAVTDTRPKRFYLRKQKNLIDFDAYPDNEASDKMETIHTQTTKPKKQEYLEKNLHPFLTYFAHLFQRCYTKTINHSKSGKKSFGEWVHPDMVGCVFPIDEWKNEVLELSTAIGNVSTKIISYELKRELSFGNLRESFFQAVSNSSWANEGYLVAAEIASDEEFISELTRLSSAFGIGIIKLDTEDPNSTEIMLPAKHRDTLEWDTINKLTMNKDFLTFIKRVRNDLTSREIRKEKYDKIFDENELQKTIKTAVSQAAAPTT